MFCVSPPSNYPLAYIQNTSSLLIKSKPQLWLV